MAMDEATYEAVLLVFWPVVTLVGAVLLSACRSLLEITQPEPWQRGPARRR